MGEIILAMTGGFLGIAVNILFFRGIERIIIYKCNQRKIEIPELNISAWVKAVFFILQILLYMSAFYLMPVTGAVFTCVFVTVALGNAIIDFYTHIIANETILFLFAAGTLYRLYEGGRNSYIGSLLAILIIIMAFGCAAVIIYWKKGILGVGAGDLKMSLAAALTVGYPGVMYFIGGMAVSLIVYCLGGIKSGFLTTNSYFPMCPQISAGFIIALFYPYVEALGLF